MKENNHQQLLRLEKLSKHFGGLAAISNLDMAVTKGEIVGLIGPNGAGKTTIFNLASGVLKPTMGKIIFEEEDITCLKPNEVAKRGLVRTFQANTLFMDFTVMENILLGCHLHVPFGFFADLCNFSFTRKKRNQVYKKARDTLQFVGLNDYHLETAKNLDHGHQRLLGVAIALAADPKLLILDEPVAGMNVEEKESMMTLVNRIREKGITVLVVEHDMRVVMGLCDRVTVINFGTKIAEGTPEEIQTNQDVIEAYLGADE